MAYKEAIVAGAGIGGIGTAIRLAAAGYKVQVFEAASVPGGKLAEMHQGGYRFDMGPSLFTLPEMVDELFALAGEEAKTQFSYRKLEVICKYFFEDGLKIDAWQDVRRFAGELEEKTVVKKDEVIKFLRMSRQIYELTAPVFIFRSFGKLSTFFSKKFLKALIHINELKAFKTMHQVNQSFFKDSRVVQLFDRYATYNGSNPYQAPGTLNVIPHLEHNTGAFFPDKGMYSIVTSLVKVAEKLGVEFHYNQQVEKILLTKNRVNGIRVNGIEIFSDLVISNIDVIQTRRLLSDPKPVKKLLSIQRSTSALIFYWGMQTTFPELQLHNIFFSDDYEAEFQDLFENKTINKDPTVYVFISSKQVPGDAPAGCENWFVMINAPENVGQNWKALIPHARKIILDKLSRQVGRNIEKFIVFEDKLTPGLIESRTGSYHGSLYGNSSNSRFAAFSRHSNQIRGIDGLYLVGGSVHPGGGIPLCLASARIVAEDILKK